MKSLTSALLALALLATASTASAAPKPRTYHFALTKVLVKESVKPEVAGEAQPRVQAAFEKALQRHPQLVAELPGAPDPDADADGYRRYLTRKGVSGAYLVTLEVTDAEIEIVPREDKKNTQRIVVSIGIHALGETVPGRTMGFTGDGHATVKQEVGMKIRDKDRELTWDDAADVAIADALKKCFASLAARPPAPAKKRGRR